jgi:hypothetical protein
LEGAKLHGRTQVYATHSSRPPFSLPQQDQESLAWASTLTAAMLAQGDTVILAENESNGSKLSV